MDYALFSDTPIEQVIRDRLDAASSALDNLGQQVGALTDEQIEEIASELEEELGFKIPQLKRAELSIDPVPRPIPVERVPRLRRIAHQLNYDSIEGIAFLVRVPFTGDRAAFRWQPTVFGENPPPPCHFLNDHDVALVFEETNDHDSAEMRASIDRYIDWIDEWIKHLYRSTSNHKISDFTRKELRSRRERIGIGERSIIEMGFPLRRRTEAPETFKLPVARRDTLKRLIEEGRADGSRELRLEERDFETILSIISDMALVMEQSPRAFRTLDEEAIRFHFLLQLNGQYRGQATGETFNFNGRSDIRVTADGRVLFIAECKFWQGPKALTETIDQLLGYLTWRNTKAAILLFNRDTQFSTVLGKIEGAVEAHRSHHRTLSRPSDTQFRFVLQRQDDPGRELDLAVIAFDIPSEQDAPDSM